MDEHEPHELTYFVQDATEHLVAGHGLARRRLEDLLADHGPAMFFGTVTALHRWDHELDHYRR
jgi:hypothetical protein